MIVGSAEPSVRILAAESNARGDLFGRLVEDFFLALGYSDCRLNIHKSGREVDLVASHRLENRHALAECKAQADHVGGAAINKFAGVLDAERRTGRYPDLSGYFLSVSGFKE